MPVSHIIRYKYNFVLYVDGGVNKPDFIGFNVINKGFDVLFKMSAYLCPSCLLCLGVVSHKLNPFSKFEVLLIERYELVDIT